MALVPGIRLGPYEVVALLGAGGMGEVYRARDTKLNRDVALKILPEAFTLDGDRIARFRREAQVLASLNHPNIAAIYGFEDSGSTHALVLELVEGPTLADRMAKGPIPLDEALPVAKQIAEALEAAHEHGIIHRDLKPANIKLRDDGTVKVLDFGLAKVMEPASAMSPALTASPTITTPAQMTGIGTLLGTAAYMSPEQAKGRPADKRSDIWAFGCVLFEMLTGTRAFEGEDVSDTLAFVLTKSPAWNALPLTTPASIRKLLQRCLEKDRKRRLADASDARLEINDALAPSATELSTATVTAAPSRAGWHSALPWTLAAALGAGLAIAVTMWAPWRRPSTPSPPVRFSIAFDGRISSPVSQFASISPDGTKIVYATDRLYVRPLADATARPIEGTDFANGLITDPTFSPDGSTIVFWAGRDLFTGELQKVAVDGGPVRTIAAAAIPFGISWGADGIVYAQTIPTALSHVPRGILRLSPNGGQPQQLVVVKDNEFAIYPQMLPGQNALLFTYVSGLPRNGPELADFDRASIVVQSLATGRRTVVVDGGSAGRYVSSGHLLYAVGGTLLAVPFDTKAPRATGSPVPVLEHVKRPAVGNNASGAALFSVSDTGSLLYVAGESIARSPNSTTILALMNGQADVQPLKLPPASYSSPRVSPDGKRIVYCTDDGKDAMIWTYDLSGATAPHRLTFRGRNLYPIWSPDGQWITFGSYGDSNPGIFRQRADGSGTPEQLTRAASGHNHVPESWSKQPTGDVLLFGDFSARETLQVLTMADRKTAPWGDISAAVATPLFASFSPDGQWVAYSIVGDSDTRVYVQPFHGTGEKSEIAVNAADPVWSHDGRELFYLSNLQPPGGGRPAQQQSLSSVKIATTPVAPLPPPTSFELKRVPGDLIGVNYDVLRDGRFIYRASSLDGAAPANPPIQVVLNWFTELKQRVPVK